MSKKIVFITSKFPFGKSEVWAFNEFNSLAELGNEIIIVPRSGKGRIINKNVKKFASNLIDLPYLNWNILIFLFRIIFFQPLFFCKTLIQVIKFSNSPLDFIKGIVILPKTLFLSKKLKKIKVDHIHSYSTTSPALVASLLSSILKVPWSYTLHSSSILNSNYRRSLFFLSSTSLACRAVSNLIANDLSNFLGPSLSKKVVTTHLGVKIDNNIKKNRFLNDPIIIVTPAELKKHKGHIYAIKAACQLVNMGLTNFKWYFYGSGPLLHELSNEVDFLNLKDYCHFPGNIENQTLLNKYKNNEVDIVVSSSISISNVFEGIPVSLMEAMSYGIPVIATDCGGTKELVDGQSGVLVNQKDSEALKNSILKFINNSEYRIEMGNNGRKKVKRDFDTSKNAVDLNKLF